MIVENEYCDRCGTRCGISSSDFIRSKERIFLKERRYQGRDFRYVLCMQCAKGLIKYMKEVPDEIKKKNMEG